MRADRNVVGESNRRCCAESMQPVGMKT